MPITLKNMARDTKLVVTIPGELNELLSRYQFLLQDIGVNRTKSQLVITLTGLAVKDQIALILKERGEDEKAEVSQGG